MIPYVISIDTQPTTCNCIHMSIYERMTSTILDARERELTVAVLRAGDEYDAATANRNPYGGARIP